MTTLHVGLGIAAATCVILFLLALDFSRHVRKRKRSRRYRKRRRLIETGVYGTPARPAPFQQFLSGSGLLRTVCSFHAESKLQTCHENGAFVADDNDVKATNKTDVMTPASGSGRRKYKKGKKKRSRVDRDVTSHFDEGEENSDGRRNRLAHLPTLRVEQTVASSGSLSPFTWSSTTSAQSSKPAAHPPPPATDTVSELPMSAILTARDIPAVVPDTRPRYTFLPSINQVEIREVPQPTANLATDQTNEALSSVPASSQHLRLAGSHLNGQSRPDTTRLVSDLSNNRATSSVAELTSYERASTSL